MHVVISRAGNEIRVSVPYAFKERAKKIKGYRWNPDLKVWTYPHSAATFSELVAEFGDDATVNGFDGHGVRGDQEPRISDELTQLEKEILAAADKMDRVTAENESLTLRIKELTAQLADARAEIESLKPTKATAEFWQRKAEEIERRFQYQKDKLVLLENRKPQSSPPPAVRAAGDPMLQLIERARAIAGNDAVFDRLLNESTFSRLPLDLAGGAERRLRAILEQQNEMPPDRVDFNFLIRHAADKQLISDEARVLLNFVRHNRNRVAHDQIPPSDLWARSCLAVLAAALLWPGLNGSQSRPA